MVCTLLLTTGCGSGFMNVSGEKTKNTSEKSEDKSKVKKVDDSLEAPQFTKNLQGMIYAVQNIKGGPLEVEATVADGGKVSYQWYRNNVNTTGGGEKVKGATKSTCEPLEKELGSVYYYVVAINEKDGAVKMSTSTTVEVQVVPEGKWVDDGSGNRKYQMYDGSYVTNTWKDIDGQRYSFDENGNLRRAQWFQDTDGSWYCLKEDGSMAKDIEVDGYAIGSDGKSADKAAAEKKQ